VYAATEAFLGRFFSDNIIATSGEELAHGITIGIPRRRLTIVHNVARRPSDLPDRAKARQSFGVAENDFLLVYVGRLSAQKAPQRFIDLVGAIRRGTPRLRALMLGYGELEAEIRRQIDSAHLGDVVSLHVDRRGWDAMAAADLFVLTSRYEGMPYTLLEAATLGVPILTTSVGGVSAITALGVSIRVVPESIGNEGFAQAACEFIATKFGSKPNRRCVLDLNTMIEETLSVYCQNRLRKCKISCCGDGKRCLPDQKDRDQLYLDVSAAQECDDLAIQTSSIVYESLS